MTHATIDRCRSCSSQGLKIFLDLGDMPLADDLARSAEAARSEQRYPLTVAFCPDCTLVQIMETVPPETLYHRNYPYYSSFSDSWVDHCRRNVESIITDRGLNGDNLVIELASNDGYLLQWMVSAGVPVLGIDPAPGPAQVAIDRGIPTLIEFFTQKLAQRLRSGGMQASVIIGNNVLAHVPDQNDFVAGLAEILDPNGVVVFEFPYVRDLIEQGEFDTIYHEHHCYFSVHAVQRLFASHGLQLAQVEHLDTHGGSLRCQFTWEGPIDPSVSEFLDRERAEGMVDFSYYRDFGERVDDIRRSLLGLLLDLTSQGSRVAAYGAAAKGATLLNYARIGDDLLEYVVDRNRHKHGWYMPGAALEVRDPLVLLTDHPEYTLLLAWNHVAEIVEQAAGYLQQGGKFIVPIPSPRILDAPRGEGKRPISPKSGRFPGSTSTASGNGRTVPADGALLGS